MTLQRSVSWRLNFFFFSFQKLVKTKKNNIGSYSFLVSLFRLLWVGHRCLKPPLDTIVTSSTHIYTSSPRISLDRTQPPLCRVDSSSPSFNDHFHSHFSLAIANSYYLSLFFLIEYTISATSILPFTFSFLSLSSFVIPFIHPSIIKDKQYTLEKLSWYSYSSKLWI